MASQADTMTDEIEVENPAPYAEKVYHPTVRVTRSLRDDPIGNMHSRGQLGPKGSEMATGRLQRARLFQSTWEASGRGRLPVSDYDGIPGSGDPARRSGITDRQIKASRQLARWCNAIGQRGFDLLVAILIDKCTVAEAARRRHGTATKAAVTFTGHRLKECLDGL